MPKIKKNSKTTQSTPKTPKKTRTKKAVKEVAPPYVPGTKRAKLPGYEAWPKDITKTTKEGSIEQLRLKGGKARSKEAVEAACYMHELIEFLQNMNCDQLSQLDNTIYDNIDTHKMDPNTAISLALLSAQSTRPIPPPPAWETLEAKMRESAILDELEAHRREVGSPFAGNSTELSPKAMAKAISKVLSDLENKVK